MIFLDILLNDLITRLNELDSVNVHVIFVDKLNLGPFVLFSISSIAKIETY